jgi:hypothetical protein
MVLAVAGVGTREPKVMISKADWADGQPAYEGI